MAFVTNCLFHFQSHKFRTCLEMSFSNLINVLMCFLEMFLGKFNFLMYLNHKRFLRLTSHIAPTMRFDIDDSDPPDLRLFSRLNKCFIVLLSESTWKEPKSQEKLLATSENFKEFPLFVLVIHKSRDSEFGIHRNLEYPIVELSMEEVIS